MRLRLLALLAVLLLPALAQARGLQKLYDATSAAAGSIDSGPLNTFACNQIQVLVTAGGAAAPSAYTVQACRTSAVASCVAFGVTLTAPGIGATSDSGSMGPGNASARAVPPYLRYQGTGGAASTIRITVYCEYHVP